MAKNNLDFKTTIMTVSSLADRVASYCKNSGMSLTEFYNRAILNELERLGDFEIRDIYEKEMEEKAGVKNGFEEE